MKGQKQVENHECGVFYFSVVQTFRFSGVLNYEGAENRTKTDTTNFFTFYWFSVFETCRFLGVLNYKGGRNNIKSQEET